MVDDPESALGPARGQRVVQRRRKVEDPDRRAEEAGADDESSVCAPGGLHDEIGTAHQRGDKRQPVTEAVRKFFCWRLREPRSCRHSAHQRSHRARRATALDIRRSDDRTEQRPHTRSDRHRQSTPEGDAPCAHQ